MGVRQDRLLHVGARLVQAQGVELPDYERPESTQTCESIFIAEAERIGFQQVTMQTRQPGDVLIMRIATRTPMHAAVLLPDERILHQQRDSLCGDSAEQILFGKGRGGLSICSKSSDCWVI